MAFEYLQRWRLHCLSGLPVQCLVTLTVQTCFLMFGGNLLCFILCLLTLVLSLGTTEKSLAASSLCSPFRYLYTLMRSHQSLLFSRFNSPSSLSLSLSERCSSALIIFVALCWTLSSMSLSLCTGEPRTGCRTPGMALTSAK